MAAILLRTRLKVPWSPTGNAPQFYISFTSVKLISTGVSRPNISTLIVRHCLPSLIPLITPTVFSQAPERTITWSPTLPLNETTGLDSVAVPGNAIPRALISAGVSGTGLDPGPTNHVTPLVLRTTYQLSSFITMLMST